MYLGIGGAPEAVLAAAAIKCVGGQMLARIWPRTDEEREQLTADGVDLKRIYGVNDLIKSENVSFAATGITRVICSMASRSSAWRSHALGDDARANWNHPLHRGVSPLAEARGLARYLDIWDFISRVYPRRSRMTDEQPPVPTVEELNALGKGFLFDALGMRIEEVRLSVLSCRCRSRR